MRKYIKLNTIETLLFWGNYIIIMFMLSFIFLIDYDKLKEIPNSLIIYIVIGILFFIHKIIVRRYTVINQELTDNQFKEVTKAHSLISNQEITKSNTNKYIALNNTMWQWEGIKFTVENIENMILINTMPTPSIRSNPFIFIFSKKNKSLTLSLIKDILDGKEVLKDAKNYVKKDEIKFWAKGEWTILLILKRILMYFVFLISLYFSFNIFENTKALIILVPLILSGHYIFWDILILLTKRDLKNNKK
tara:strand:+ start:238 stop:981 length:744 start_codon:yes stop_codon:yes gene_type:complete